MIKRFAYRIFLPLLFGCGSAYAADWQTAATVTPQAPSTVSASVPSSSYFQITADDVTKEVVRQLKLQAVEQEAQASLAAGLPRVIYSADHPLELTIHALQIDASSKRWQGQANIRANGQTETVRPISGTYTPMVSVPVLKKQVGRNDIIEASDLSSKLVPDRLVRKDTVSQPSQLIGQSPRATITPDRPIRLMEISSPVVIKKGQPVEITYTSTYMTLKASGVALQDGAKGDLIRVKNDKSEKAVTGRVQEAGRVETNQSPAL